MQPITDELIKGLFTLEKTQNLAKKLNLTINLSKERSTIEVIDNNTIIYWSNDIYCIKGFLEGIKYALTLQKTTDYLQKDKEL